MKTIDERLEYAAEEVRHVVAQVPSRGAKVAGRASQLARRAVQVVAVVALIVATIAGSSMLLNGDGDVSGGAGEFPRIALATDVAEGELSLVFAEDGVTSPQPANPNLLEVFHDPSADLASGWIFVVADADGSDFFRNLEAIDDPGDPVPVPIGAAYLLEEGFTSQILWQLGDEDGLVVTIQGLGVGTETLLDVLAGIQYDETGVEVGFLPTGFMELYSGPTRTEGEREVMFIWATSPSDDAQAEVTLQLHQRAEAPLERGMYNFTLSGISAISETEVLGKPALRLEVADAVAFQWLQSPTVYARLTVLRSVDPDAIAAALREVDSATWDQMFEIERPDEEIYLGPGETLLSEEPTVVQGAPAVEPLFNAAELGEEAPLGRLTDLTELVAQIQANNESDVFRITVIGVTGDGATAALLYADKVNPDLGPLRLLCVWIDGASACGGTPIADLADQPSGLPVGLQGDVVALTYTTPGPSELAWGPLPEGTSVVVFTTNDTSVWQRPVGGVAVFDTDLRDGDVFVLTALDADGDTMVRQSTTAGS